MIISLRAVSVSILVTLTLRQPDGKEEEPPTLTLIILEKEVYILFLEKSNDENDT